MNRIIKFRGKRVDNGEWVEGSFIHDWDNGCEIAEFGIKALGCHPVEVIPESVGQFTGLLDKNKVEIYEKCIINDKYRVDYKGYKYVLTDISNNDTLDILEVQKDENGLTITKEYSEV